MKFYCDGCKKKHEHYHWRQSGTGDKTQYICGEYLSLGYSYDGNKVSAYYKHEKSGEMIPVNKKGNIVDGINHYKEGDPRGWKAAGKGTKGYERSLFLDEGGNVKKTVKHKR